MADVSYNLRKATLAWMRGVGSETRSKLSWQTFCNVAELLKYAWHERRSGSMMWVREGQGCKRVRFTVVRVAPCWRRESLSRKYRCCSLYVLVFSAFSCFASVMKYVQ